MNEELTLDQLYKLYIQHVSEEVKNPNTSGKSQKTDQQKIIDNLNVKIQMLQEDLNRTRASYKKADIQQALIKRLICDIVSSSEKLNDNVKNALIHNIQTAWEDLGVKDSSFSLLSNILYGQVLRVDAYAILEENYYNLKLYCEELEEKIEELEDE